MALCIKQDVAETMFACGWKPVPYDTMFTPPYHQLARFAGSLSMGIESALTLPRAFSIALRSLHRTRIVRAMDQPVEQVRGGTSIADTLRQAQDRLPSFVVPTIQAGEETGRLEESLHFLERHCDMLSGPAKNIRNAWLVPLCILLAGDLGCIAVSLGMGSISGAADYLVVATIRWAVTMLLIWMAYRPMVQPYFDRIKLRLPGVGSIERDIANHRFFRILALLYGVSNAPVDRMLDTATDSISNLSARAEFRKAADAIRQQESIEQAFKHPQSVLNDEQLTRIAAGEIAGKLESTFSDLADTAGGSLKQKLAEFQQLTSRFATLTAAATIIGVAMRLSSR